MNFLTIKRTFKTQQMSHRVTCCALNCAELQGKDPQHIVHRPTDHAVRVFLNSAARLHLPKCPIQTPREVSREFSTENLNNFFFFFFDMGSCYFDHAGLKLLGSSHFPTSASQVNGLTVATTTAGENLRSSRAGDVTQWYSACLSHARSWVGSSIKKKTKKKKARPHREIIQ